MALASSDTATSLPVGPLSETADLPWHGRLGRLLPQGRAGLSSLLLVLLLVGAVEWITRRSGTEALAFLLDPLRPGLATAGLVILLALSVDALAGRRYLGLLVLLPLALLPAFISRQKQLFLSDPLYPADLLFGRQVMALMPVLVRDRPLMAAAVVFGLLALLVGLALTLRLCWRRFPVLSLRQRLKRLAVVLPIMVALVPFLDYHNYFWLRDRLRIVPIMWDQTENYRHNGFLMAFALNAPMARVSAPSGYSAEAIHRMDPGPVPFGTTHRTSPDVIMVMSESLFDPTRLPRLQLSPDPMPTMRALQSGHVFSPEFGGMTANVEFEALTGFSNAFLPYGSIPYQQYVRESLPSLAAFFRAEGYVARAIHPFQRWFWNRETVYSAFGFEEFRSEERLPPLDKRGQFASDDALMGEIMRQADLLDRPFFFFAVTLQGHGPYEAGRYPTETVTVTGDLPDAERAALSTYAQGVQEADKALARLIDWAEQRDRETIILLFGDHLPPLNAVYPESGFMPDVTAARKGKPADMALQHETPLILWSNRTGPVRDLGTISPALLPYHLLKAGGFEHPFYTEFLGKVAARYSVLDRHLLLNAQGKAAPDWLQARKLDPLLADYRMLQHDMLFGRRHGSDPFFRGDDRLLANEGQHPGRFGG
ncbi:LTA synthase family protein [Xaviernesmea oryzae]|nr:LTA synthase family protein [Xaviernesmea oryzae]SEL70219.1 Phosphoglycerol transferase MdoB [Xaviernesmea oryzae]